MAEIADASRRRIEMTLMMNSSVVVPQRKQH
jgi:hypothetical protein